MLKCDWNSTQFSVTPVRFNSSTYNWEQIKFHLQNIHDNASLKVQLLQKEIFGTFSKNLPSSTNLETLAEQPADQLSGLDPRGWLQSIIHSTGSGTVILVIVLTIISVVHHCLHAKLLELNKLKRSEPFLQISGNCQGMFNRRISTCCSSSVSVVRNQ